MCLYEVLSDKIRIFADELANTPTMLTNSIEQVKRDDGIIQIVVFARMASAIVTFIGEDDDFPVIDRIEWNQPDSDPTATEYEILLLAYSWINKS